MMGQDGLSPCLQSTEEMLLTQPFIFSFLLSLHICQMRVEKQARQIPGIC